MNETELERLVIRLTGDTSGFSTAFNAAAATAAQVARQVQGSAQQIEQLGTGLKGFAGQAVSALALLGVASSGAAAFGKFSGSEQTMLRLTAAIEANGRAVQPAIADYTAFASAVAAQTLTTKASALSMLQQAESMGLSAEASKRVVTNAIALAGATGHEAESMFRVATALEQGNMHALRHVPALRGIKDETELLARAQQLLGSGLKVAQAEAQSTSGQIERLKRSLGAVSVEIGGMIANGLRPIVGYLADAVKWFNALDPQVRKITVAVLGLMVGLVSLKPTLAALTPVFGVLASGLSIFSTIAGVVFSPLGIGLAFLAANVAVAVQQLGGFGNAWKLVEAVALVAWDGIKKGVSGFLAWAAPIGAALVSLFGTAWGEVKKGVLALWDVAGAAFERGRALVASVMESLGLDTSGVFADLRGNLIKVIQSTEENFRRLGGYLQSAGGAMAQAWTKVVEAMTPIVEQSQAIGSAVVTAVGAWIASNRNLLLTLGSVAAGVLAVVGVAKGLALAFGLVQAVLAVLHVQEIASAAAWGVWTGAVMAAQGVMLLYNTQVAIWNALAVAAAFLAGAWAAGVAAFNAAIAASVTLTAIWNAHGLIMKALVAGSAVLTAAWTVGVLVANAALWAWNAALAVWNANGFVFKLVAAASTILAVGWSVGAMVAKAATWAWNAALTAMNALLGGAALAAAVGTVVILAGAFWGAAAAVWGVYKAGDALFTTLLNLPTTTGPIRAVVDLFREWGGIIADVVRIARTDMPAAWGVLEAGAALAVNQVKDLFPPLWAFIKSGSAAVAQLVGKVFAGEFRLALGEMSSAFFQFLGAIDPTGKLAAASKAKLEVLREYTKGSLAADTEWAEKRLAAALGKFKLEESKETKAAREALGKLVEDADVERVNREIAALEEYLTEGAIDPAVQASKKASDQINKSLEAGMVAGFKNAHREVSKFDAALVGSAEAITRLAEYRDRLEYGLGGEKARQGIFGGGAGQRFDATQKASAEGSAREEGWKAVVDEIKKSNEKLDALRAKEEVVWTDPLPGSVEIRG